MTVRSYTDARAWAVGQTAKPAQNWSGMCQKFARSCVNAGSWATSALNAWNSTPAIHRHTNAPRGGALAYFGDTQPGHAVFVDPANPAYCFSSDILRPGKIDRVPIKLITTKWGLRYRGWIDWTSSGALSLVPIAVVKPVVTPASKPAVSLKNLISAAKSDPKLAQGKSTYPQDTKIVEDALRKEGLLKISLLDGAFGTSTVTAYAAWQKKCKVTPANGIPDAVSLKKLGASHTFDIK
jgi:hypothetical protein